MLAEPTNLRIALWIVLLAILLPVGSALLLLTHMVGFLTRPEVLVGGSVIRLGIGLTPFRPNRMYPQKGGTPYRLATAWGASHVYHRPELEEGIQGQDGRRRPRRADGRLPAVGGRGRRDPGPSR